MRVYRSPLRLFFFGLVGVLLMLASVDVMFGHWISTEPENNEGVLTTRGQAQQRGDIVWGGALIGVGTLLFGGAIVDLVRRKPLVRMGKDGIVLAIGATVGDVAVPWDAIDTVTSGVLVDEVDGSRREQLLLTINDPSVVPDDLISATWDGRMLSVDAHDWTKRVTDVALAAQGSLDYHRRVEEIKSMGEPHLTWETKVPAPPDAHFTDEEESTQDEPIQEEPTEDESSEDEPVQDEPGDAATEEDVT